MYKSCVLILCILFLPCCAKQHGSGTQADPTVGIGPAEQDNSKPLMIGGKQFVSYRLDLEVGSPGRRKAFTLGDNLDDIVSLEFFIDPLDSSRMNSLEGIEQLYAAKNIDRIRIDVRNLDDIDLSPLEKFANITELDISINGNSRVLPDLTAFKSLRVLRIRGVLFEQPYTLYVQPGLTNLTLDEINNLYNVDLFVIETLNDLRSLLIAGDFVKIPDLTKLENLRFITIGSRYTHTVLESLEGIGAPNVSQINVGNVKEIDSLAPLNNLLYLESLKTGIPGGKVYQIAEMANLPNLKTLSFSIGKIDLQGIENLPTLEKLWLDECEPYNIEGIGKLQNLKVLSINLMSSEPSLEFLRNMPNLSALYLYPKGAWYDIEAYQVLDLSPLATLKKLQLDDFECRSFIIKNISALDALEPPIRGYVDFYRSRLYDRTEKSRHNLVLERFEV
jgi:hypothetical protein